MAGRTRHVALMRGINVGGRNKLPMKLLREIFEGAGCVGVESYIQSGNVAFDADADLAARVPELVADRVEAELGFRVPVVTRTAAEMKAVVDGNPFLARDPGPKALHVAFLADTPDGAAVASLDPDRSPPDEFVVAGRDVYLCCPNGVARTRLTNAWFDSRLDTVSTMRNWRTVQKLLAMATTG